jgi:hypothetical protein
MKRSLLFAVAGALLAGACGGAEEPATAYLDDFASHASAFQAAERAHATEIAGASGVKATAPMEQAHLADVSAHLDRMGRDVGMMGMCMDANGTMMSTGDMSSLVQHANEECARHAAAMASAPDMAAAMAEEDAHQATMSAMFGQMMDMRGMMMNGGASMMGTWMGASEYTCPMMSSP